MISWQSIRNLGVTPAMDYNRKRYIVITNVISLLISGFTTVVAAAGYAYFGMIYSIQLAIIFTVVFSFPLLINSFGYTNFSRVFLSVIISAASVFISVIDKFDAAILEEFQYFEFRLMLMCASLIPFIVFRLAEKKYLMISLVFNFLCLMLYDPIHELFDVGYYQMGMKGPNYAFLNFMFFACFSILVGCTYFLKSSFETYESENRLLIDELSVQKKEITEANAVISAQRAALAEENATLNQELIEKNEQLMETNEQLIQHNNDLQQFSYTVSHNLRGPVASLIGLASLVDEKALGESNRILFDHLRKSVTSLDITIRDLSHIIDIRNTISKMKQRINLNDEVEQVCTLLRKEIIDHDVEVVVNLDQGSEIYSVKPMVSSILYNLISNSIKYRAVNRRPSVMITSRIMDDCVTIEVRDNGLGLNLEKHKEKLFGLYKRFHTHVDGKGLGLFLVKLQAESLGGKVEIESKEGHGSVFRVFLANASTPDHQIVMDKEWGKLYYDALRNTSVVVWKRALKVDEFADFFRRCVEFNNTQHCPNWIVEIQQGTKAEDKDEEYERARLQFANEMKRTSLKRMGYVIAPENEPPRFDEYKNRLTEFYQGRIQFFQSMAAAQEWIDEQVQREKAATESASA